MLAAVFIAAGMRVREVFAQGECCVAVCDYAEGRTLDELLSGGRTFPTAELRSIVTQLCSAIGHLHRYGIIHRDVAPKNIILDDTLRLTLIDYDISRRYSGKRGQDTALYGTEGFAPPEQYGFRETAFTADIYALGMVMKLLLNACPDCPAAQEVLLRRAAAKCTRFVPDRRYRSAGAVRRAVSRSRFVVPAGAAGTLALAVQRKPQRLRPFRPLLQRPWALQLRPKNPCMKRRLPPRRLRQQP